MAFLFGAAGAALVLAAAVSGSALGWRLRGRARPKPETPDEAALRALASEQEAFRRLQHYSAETAYGLGERDSI